MRQKLVADDRTLSFPYINGTPPFGATLSNNGRLIARGQASSTQIVFNSVRLSSGSLELIIEDGEKRKSVTAITVVNAPPRIPDMSAAAANNGHRVLLEAGWLLAEPEGTWLLEAYQRLEAVSKITPAAAIMQRGLTAGDRP